jgi:exodeoxyribonuclease VII small subunit
MATRKAVAGEKQSGTFEQALQRLEAIVRDMEGGTLSLDVMIQRFEEGQALIAVCNRKLNEVERKIEMLVRKDGETATAPFEGDDGGDGEPGAGDSDDGKKESGNVPF